MRKINMIRLGIGMAALSAFMMSATVSAQSINADDTAGQIVEAATAEDQTVVEENAVAPDVVEKLNQMAANNDRLKYYVPYDNETAPGVVEIMNKLVENPDKTPQELFADQIISPDDERMNFIEDYYGNVYGQTIIALKGQNGFFAYDDSTGAGEFIFECTYENYIKTTENLETFDDAFPFENYSWVSYLPDDTYQEVFYDPWTAVMCYRTENLRNR